MTALGCDLGIRPALALVESTGQGTRLVAGPVLLTSTADREVRATRLLAAADAMLAEHGRPDVVATERPFTHQGDKRRQAGMHQSYLLGVLAGWCSVHGISLRQYGPNTVKLAFTGSGRADKLQMIEAARQRYGVVVGEHTADAMGIAHCAAIRGTVERELAGQGVLRMRARARRKARVAP